MTASPAPDPLAPAHPTRVAVVGTGAVGSTFAFALVLSGLASEIVLIDANARRAEGEAMSVCLVGEPTCPERLGDAMKIGRRGSLTAHVVAKGVQGHSAYPHKADNPIPKLARFIDRIAAARVSREEKP